jgi:uncharacterized membrane protein
VNRSSGPLDESDPATSSPTPESYTWPLVALVLVILPQVLVPAHDRVGPPLLVPIIEGAALLTMLAIAALPGAVPARTRPAVLAALGVLVLANAGAAIRLVTLVLGNGFEHHGYGVDRLLIAGAMVLATNLITFALLYWQLDGGGPDGRAAGSDVRYRDFQFPQLAEPEKAPPGWQPRFADYLYVAYTNVVAFSPTDTLPFTRRAKGLMTLQSVTTLAVLVVVLARVINALPS